jgi:hypothetical protein
MHLEKDRRLWAILGTLEEEAGASESERGNPHQEATYEQNESTDFHTG